MNNSNSNSSNNHNNNNNNNSNSNDNSTTTAATGNQTPDTDIDTDTTPRDVRLLRLIFAAQGVDSYEDHVPLQLMDFAHRYTREVLQDAMIYNDYAHPSQSNAGNIGGGPSEEDSNNMASNLNNTSNSNASNLPMLNNDDIKLAISARTSYQFNPIPPKKMLMELANERNEKPLPAVMPIWGVRLPPEKYCLTEKDSNEN